MSGLFLLPPLHPIVQFSHKLTPARIGVALALTVALLVLGLFLAPPVLSLVVLSVATTLLVLVAGLCALRTAMRQLREHEIRLLGQVIAGDPAACLLVDAQDHRIIGTNRSAGELLTLSHPMRIGALFEGVNADPDALVGRLHDHARAQGGTSHQHADGQHYQIRTVASGLMLWRVEIPLARDPRHALPFAMAQWDGRGELSYLSPGLSAAMMQAGISRADFSARLRRDPEALIASLPEPVPRGAALLHLPGATGQTGATLLVLPPGLSPPLIARDDAKADALDALPVAIARLRPDGHFTYLNKEARRLLHVGQSEPPLVSALLEGLGRPVVEWLADVASGRLARATEVLRLHDDNEETYLRVTLARPVYGMRGEVIAAISDVTELKSLEAKFTQSQKMQAIGQLAGGVAHDFNNLLTAISGHCDLLLLRHDRSDLDYPDLMQIQQNTNRAAALVRQLLALSRQQKLKLVTLDLQDTLADVIHLLNRLVGEKVTLSLRQGENVAPIRTDKRQFEQVLMNLVVNARDALPIGGEIRIETEAVQFAEDRVRDGVHLPAGDYTAIHIQDDGTGIPHALIGKVFDPFFTTKRPGEGTGLGLSTVYGIIKQSGGYIFVASDEGMGTTFTLYFAAQPRDAVQVVEKPRRKSLPPAALRKRHALVLLVEDEAPVRAFAARALELQGHRVIEADSGEAALEVLSDPEIRPDFFVTDVIMPGLDGPSWVAQVRDRFPETPVLFMSGYAEDSRVAAQAQISNASFIGKPFSLAEFTEAVNSQMQRNPKAA